MEIFGNKLYCILDAANRSDLNCDQIMEMITYHVIMAPKQFGVAFILGEDIPDLKAKWIEWQAKKKKMEKAHSEKDPIKNTKVTMLRMDKGN